MKSLQPFGLLIGPEDVAKVTAEFLSLVIHENPLVVFRGFAAFEREQFLALCRSVPNYAPVEWSFGPVMEVRESVDPQNYLFSREAVPYHWDGAFHSVPDFLAFNCIEAPSSGAGGETLFANTELICESARKDEREIWSQIELQYETAKLAHYGGKIRAPLVQRHPRTGRSILRFAEPVETKLNPVCLRLFGVDEELAASTIQSLTQKVYSPRFCYKHEWNVGDLLIADNHTLIHGRTAFEVNAPRHLRRIQLKGNA